LAHRLLLCSDTQVIGEWTELDRAASTIGVVIEFEQPSAGLRGNPECQISIFASIDSIEDIQFGSTCAIHRLQSAAKIPEIIAGFVDDIDRHLEHVIIVIIDLFDDGPQRRRDATG
jgi:hypothetical protein